MIFYPDLYLDNVKEITIDILRKNNIKGLLLDVDNTLIDFNLKILDGVEEWCNNLKDEGIKMCIASNTYKEKKVKRVAKKLNLQYMFFSKKPTKKAFKKSIELLKLEPKNIAVVGDQILTDIYGGNRMKMFTILTKPLGKKDVLITRLKRPLENLIIKKYLRNIREKSDI